MNSTARTHTPGRLIGLVLIGLTLAGLALVRFSSADPVEVPAGAKAGQLVDLKTCEYPTEAGDRVADCGTLVVPENRNRADSRLIALPVTRIRARTDSPRAPLFRLEGGPGLSNMKFPRASRFADTRDVVLVGYRGVDGTPRLDCPEVADAMRRSADLLAAASMRERTSAYRQCVERLEKDGVDLTGYTIPQRVDDLEAARRALGYGKIDLVSESAGTRYAMVYAWRYPRSIRRSVMLAANPPGNFVWNPQVVDSQLRRYGELCAEVDACNRRTESLARLIQRNNTDIPGRWGPLAVKPGNVRVASFWGLMHTDDDNGPLGSPLTLDSWMAAANGDASGFWFQSFAANLMFPYEQAWGELAAIGVADAEAVERRFRSEPASPVLGDPGSRMIWADGRLADVWPATAEADEYDRVRDSEVETLVVSGELDFATPPVTAQRELMPHLPNGRQVVLEQFGHSDDLWDLQPDASAHLIRTFLDSGRVDSSRFAERRIGFDPEMTQTMLAKILAGTMGGLALVTLVTLIWLPLRVRRRGQIGPKAGAYMRSLHAPVAGLGGWFLASLFALTAMPSTPVDAEGLVVLSTGLPIAVVTYCGSVKRRWDGETKRTGFAAAGLAALVGAWLGIQAPDSALLAPLTAIAGAVALANLALIVVDVASERSAQAAQTTPEPERVLAGAA